MLNKKYCLVSQFTWCHWNPVRNRRQLLRTNVFKKNFNMNLNVITWNFIFSIDNDNSNWKFKRNLYSYIVSSFDIYTCEHTKYWRCKNQVQFRIKFLFWLNAKRIVNVKIFWPKSFSSMKSYANKFKNEFKWRCVSCMIFKSISYIANKFRTCKWRCAHHSIWRRMLACVVWDI